MALVYRRESNPMFGVDEFARETRAGWSSLILEGRTKSCHPGPAMDCAQAGGIGDVR
jgi:hypothetical protein